MKNDFEHKGVLCFEEPENGVHPNRIKKLYELLKGMTTDFSNEEDQELPLRQLIVNTHSPVFVARMLEGRNTDKEEIPELLFAHTVTRVSPKYGTKMRVTKMVPVNPSPETMKRYGIEQGEVSYAYSEVLNYLNSSDLGESVELLKKKLVK